MTATQATISDWTTEHDRRPEYDDDPTPRGVTRAVLDRAIGDFAPMHHTAASDHIDGLGYGHPGEEQSRTTRVLDLGAGYGCWSSEMRRLAHEQGWPVHITGVELNPGREPDLRKWCDDARIADWRRYLGWRCKWCGENPGQDIRDGIVSMCEDCSGTAFGHGGFDIIIGNPPFAELLRKDGEFPLDEDGALDPAQTMVGIALRHAPAVLFLHTQQAFLKSFMGRAVQRAYPPAACWQIPGSVGFRGDGKADSACYEATLWLRDHTGPCSRYLLPELAAEDRRWTVPPGSESPAEAEALGLPLAPGYNADNP